MQGSKREYFALLLKMFCMAPTSTASIKGVVPKKFASGATVPGRSVKPKKPRPVTPIIFYREERREHFCEALFRGRLRAHSTLSKRTAGVTKAANFQPNFSKIVRPSSIITRVTAPVADEKFPMKAEYSLGFGNACYDLKIPHVSCGDKTRGEVYQSPKHTVAP